MYFLSEKLLTIDHIYIHTQLYKVVYAYTHIHNYTHYTQLYIHKYTKLGNNWAFL